MIVITGGAGMIGSIIAWHLNTKLNRDDLVIVDNLAHESQWQNLVKRQYAQYLQKDQLMEWLQDRNDIDAVIHMGAISATTERDFSKLVADNIHYSQNLWTWCAAKKCLSFTLVLLLLMVMAPLVITTRVLKICARLMATVIQNIFLINGHYAK